MYELQFDGLFRRIGEHTKSGVMAYGWLIFHDGIGIARGYGVVAGRNEATSNIAEYLALIEGLIALQDMGLFEDTINVSGDSKIVISQMCGQSAIHAEGMKELYELAYSITQEFDRIYFEWRKRSKNKAADMLTRYALKQARKNYQNYEKIVHELIISRGKHKSENRNLLDSFLPLVDISVFHPHGLVMLH